MTSRIAIATCDQLPDGDAEDAPLLAALRQRGAEVSVVSWSDPTVAWDSFDLTVLRSTWDYTVRREEFLTWAASVPRLHNPADVLRTNSDKTYLAILAEAGLPIVPTEFFAPDQTPTFPTEGEFVVKPSVGAGSRGAGRFDPADPDALTAAAGHAEALQQAGRTVLVQPYQTAVDTQGESALILIDGTFSHSIRKGAMLSPAMRHGLTGDSLYIEENIAARTASPAEIELAEQVLAVFSKNEPQPLLYARVDLLPGANGPVIVEAELTEPSLFFTFADGSADKLATAIMART